MPFLTPSAVGRVLPLLLPVEAEWGEGTQVSHLACSAIRGRGVPRQSRGAGWLRLPSSRTAARADGHMALPHPFLHHARGALLPLADAEWSDSPLWLF